VIEDAVGPRNGVLAVVFLVFDDPANGLEEDLGVGQGGVADAEPAEPIDGLCKLLGADVDVWRTSFSGGKTLGGGKVSACSTARRADRIRKPQTRTIQRMIVSRRATSCHKNDDTPTTPREQGAGWGKEVPRGERHDQTSRSGA